MHIAIDRQSMRVTHAHTNAQVVAGLVYLECAHVNDVRIESNTHEGFLARYTPIELELLHYSLTDHSYRGSDLVQVIAALCDKLPQPQVNERELDAQILAVQTKGLSERGVSYRYVFGKQFPSETLFALPYKVKALTDAELLSARTREFAAYAPAAPVQSVRPAGAPRLSGVTAIVWETADKLWAAAGSPMETPKVLTLRKEIMNVLESEHGVKRNTSSNELGKWHKARVPSPVA
jgi:hypothetical protein